MLEPFYKQCYCGILVYCLAAPLSIAAQADALENWVTSKLQQQNTQLNQENQRLQAELKRMQTQAHCASVQAPPASVVAPRSWQYMSEQYGLPIVGY